MSTAGEGPSRRMESATIPELRLAPPGRRGEPIERIPGPDPIRTARDRETGLYTIEIDRVGQFYFTPGAAEVRTHPDPGATPATLRAAHLATVLPLALQAAGHQLLHASAIDTPEGVIAFCGPSGAGKSTLAAALARRGHRQWADDAVWWEIDRNERGEPIGARTRRLPFQQRLRPDVARWLGIEGTVASDGPTLRRLRPLRAVYVLARGPRQEPMPTSLRLVRAFPALLDNAYHFPTERNRLGDLAEAYLALAIAVPVIRLDPPGDLDSLEAALDRLEEHLLRPPGPAVTDRSRPDRTDPTGRSTPGKRPPAGNAAPRRSRPG